MHDQFTRLCLINHPLPPMNFSETQEETLKTVRIMYKRHLQVLATVKGGGLIGLT
jgi:hypothetical protein